MDKFQEKIFLTREGKARLEAEYKALEGEKRPRAVERLALSRSLGDLTENNDYIQAKEELSFIDGRLNELEQVLKRIKIITENHQNCQAVKLGCQVTVKAKNREQIFHLVGEWEADPVKQKISHQSPLGQALMGKKVGDKVEIEVPAGKLTYLIARIK